MAAALDPALLALAEDRAEKLIEVFLAAARLCFVGDDEDETAQFVRTATLCKALTMCLAVALGPDSLIDGTFEDTVKLLRTEILDQNGAVQ